MKRLLTFPEQLARQLTEQIDKGILSNPLPGRRAWAAQLGVGRHTLDAAVEILVRKGRLMACPRQGTKISSKGFSVSGSQPSFHIRLIFNDRDFERSAYTVDWLFPLLIRFHERGFRCTFEKASTGRVADICRKGGNPSELNLLWACSLGQLRQFQRSKANVLVIGDIEKGICLPSVNVDLDGAIRHACHDFLRRGIKNLKLLVNAHTKGIPFENRDAFFEACANWPVQPVRYEMVQIPMHLPEMIGACRKLAGNLQDRTGLIILFPLSAAAMTTVLLQRGIPVPAQVEMIVVMSRPDSIKLDPMPKHYPFPLKRFVRELTQAVNRFFETGKLPSNDHRYVPLEMG